MKKNLFSSLIILGIAACLSSSCCDFDLNPTSNSGVAPGPQVSAKRPAENFDSVSIGIAADVEVEVGPASSVSVTGASDVVSKITTDVQGGRLVVSRRDLNYSGPPPKVAITLPKLSAFVLSGSGNCNIKGLNGGQISVDLSGSGSINLDGSTNEATVTIEGSGTVNAKNCKVNSASVDLNGSGNIKFAELKNLKVELDGSGNVTYLGDPKIESQVNGSGSITHE